MTATLAQRIGVGVLLSLGVMLPVLYYNIDRVVAQSAQDEFITQARATVRTLVDQFETTGLPQGEPERLALLDSLALSGNITLAELTRGDQVLRSRLSTMLGDGKAEDFQFGRGAGNIYIVTANFMDGAEVVKLRLGFDEVPTIERIAAVRRVLLLLLSLYATASLVAAWWLSRYLTLPMKELQLASRRIASGERSAALSVHSGSREMRALAMDLDQMRNELVGATTRLQQQMDERAQLEAQLRQKQRLETVGTLAGGIAHEFNNVLVPITLRTEMALESLPAGHAARSDLSVVLSAARRARDTVRKILGFGRHMSDTPPTRMNIAPAIDEALHLIDSLRPASVSLHRDIDPQCPPVMADTTSIVHIVLNLCSNGLQAMQNDSGSLTIRLHSLTDAGSRFVELQVADSGHGMDAATQERIFEPFFTTREVGQGTGLGLSVVHGMVTALGGQIRVTSAPEAGTTFYVRFPA